MFQQFFSILGRIYQFMVSLVITALLGLATWVCWGFYEEASLQSRFASEGRLVSVRVSEVSHEQRSWRDVLGNSAYLTVQYQGRPYTTRFVTDTTFVSEGDRVSLLYHPDYDALRQPEPAHQNPAFHKSRLIRWSTINEFTIENKLLLLCFVLATAFFFYGSGVLTMLIPVPFLQDMARLVLTIELFAVAVFFAYDTYAYFQYYQGLKTHGRAVAVTVLDTHRRSVGGKSRHGWYEYQANVRRNNQAYTIPISEADYDMAKPGHVLRAIYDESMPDLMSADFPPDYKRLFIPVFFGVFAVILLRSTLRRRGQLPESVAQRA